MDRGIYTEGPGSTVDNFPPTLNTYSRSRHTEYVSYERTRSTLYLNLPLRSRAHTHPVSAFGVRNQRLIPDIARRTVFATERSHILYLPGLFEIINPILCLFNTMAKLKLRSTTGRMRPMQRRTTTLDRFWARPPRAGGHQIRMRRGAVRSMHRTPQRNSCAASCSISCIRLGARRGVTTIEGLSERGDHPVQLAWDEVDVTTSVAIARRQGQIMSAAALLAKKPQPTDAEIDYRDERQLHALVRRYTIGIREAASYWHPIKSNRRWKHPHAYKTSRRNFMKLCGAAMEVCSLAFDGAIPRQHP